ncbi:MAG: hypothetical protein R6U85_10315 [Salinivirgaceae bacterium]
MKKFSDLNIKPTRAFVGEKISISKVLNKKMAVLNSRIDDSKFTKNKSGKCLALQIEIDGSKRVLFSGSEVLMQQIAQVSDENYPFETEIVKQGEHFEFT